MLVKQIGDVEFNTEPPVLVLLAHHNGVVNGKIGLEERGGACVVDDATLDEVAVRGAGEISEIAAALRPLARRRTSDDRQAAADWRTLECSLSEAEHRFHVGPL